MDRESRLGRMLWVGFVAFLCLLVAANFVRSPLDLGSSGRAAIRPAQLTIWVTGPEAGGEGMVVAREAAAGLELAGHTTVVKRLGEGSSQGVAAFLARRPPRRGRSLLLISSSTLADIAHERREYLVPGVEPQALLARDLLLRSHAVGLLATEPLELGVAPDSPVTDGAGFLAAMRGRPGRQRVALTEDSFSRVALGSLVARSEVHGLIRFQVNESGGVAVEAARSGEASSVLAPRGALLPELRAGRLRRLGWPPDGGGAPRAWFALVAAPPLSPSAVTRLRRWVGGLASQRPWRATQRRAGRSAPRLDVARLGALPRNELRRAEHAELVAERVEER